MLGGARSGKSRYAESLFTGAVRYLAAARVRDADFAARVAEHRNRRPATWTTVEGDLVAALQEHRPTLLDDVGTWLTNLIDDAAAWEQPRGTVDPAPLVAAVAGFPDRLVVVSPEVGLGVVPHTESGRLFRDELGLLNQQLADVCDEVVLVVAGQPLRVK